MINHYFRIAIVLPITAIASTITNKMILNPIGLVCALLMKQEMPAPLLETTSAALLTSAAKNGERLVTSTEIV